MTNPSKSFEVLSAVNDRRQTMTLDTTHGPRDDLPSKRYPTREMEMIMSVKVTNPSASATQICDKKRHGMQRDQRGYYTDLVDQRQRLTCQIQRHDRHGSEYYQVDTSATSLHLPGKPITYSRGLKRGKPPRPKNLSRQRTSPNANVARQIFSIVDIVK